MLKSYFRKAGYDVLATDWGEKGIQVCLEHRPSLVILDIRLPDIDGFEVARRLRSHPHTRHTPIIFLTEERTHESRLQGLKLSAVDYITKPFDVQELRLKVRNTLMLAAQHASINPITAAPQGAIVDEYLQNCLQNPACAILLITLHNFDDFRERNGFVAADDLLRAVFIMLDNLQKELALTDSFLGHFSTTDFILIAPRQVLPGFQSRASARLAESLDIFHHDPDRSSPDFPDRRLKAVFHTIEPNRDKIGNLISLKQTIQNLSTRESH